MAATSLLGVGYIEVAEITEKYGLFFFLASSSCICIAMASPFDYLALNNRFNPVQ